MSNKNNLIIGVFIIVVIAVVFAFWNKTDSGNQNQYSVVHLVTGEVYIGKLSTFPDMELKDSYILEITADPKDPTKNNFQLNPINKALWATNTLHLENKNVVFYGPLLPTSTIATKLAEQVK